MSDLEETIARIRANPLATIHDIRAAQRDVKLVEYFITPKHGAVIEPPPRPKKRRCRRCRKSEPVMYNHRSMWYCTEHLPKGITWPVGMHGDDLKKYKEETK